MNATSGSAARGRLWVAARLRPWLPLLLVTLLAAALRLCQLGSWSIWVDEAHTWRDATVPLASFWESERASYPISFLLVRVLGGLVGYEEVWLRLPFALIGIAAVPALGHFAAPLVGARAALWAALLLAVNPWHIYWSQNARAYVLVFLFAILASTACWSGVQRRSWGRVGVGVALGLLAVLSHPSAYLMLATLGVYVVIAALSMRPTPKLPPWGIAVGCAMLAGLSLLLLVSVGDLRSFARAKPNPSLLHLLETSAFYFRPMLLLTAAGAAALMIKGRDRVGAFLALWAVVPPLSLLLLPVFGVQVTARYAFVSLPAILVLAGWLGIRIADTLRPVGSHGLRYLVLLLLLVDSGTYDYFYFASQYGDRPRWREAVEYIRSHSEGEDRALLTTNEPTMNYYLRPGIHSGEDRGLRGEYSILEWEVTAAGGGAAFMRKKLARAQGRTLFVVVTEPELEEKDPDGGIRRFLGDNFHQVARFLNRVGPKDQTVLVFRSPDSK